MLGRTIEEGSGGVEGGFQGVSGMHESATERNWGKEEGDIPVVSEGKSFGSSAGHVASEVVVWRCVLSGNWGTAATRSEMR